MSYRFFGQLDNLVPVLSDTDVFHLTKVLRIKAGETIEVVVDNTLFLCAVASFSPFKFVVKEMRELPQRNGPYLTLLYAIPKGDKLDLVVQKATELGVDAIILVETAHAVGKISTDKQAAKHERFMKIIKAAAMQSKQNSIPKISGPIPLHEAVNLSFDLKLIAHEKATISFRNILSNKYQKSKNVCVLIGPEGGFSDAEVALAAQHDFVVVSFGANILRSETAVFYALSVLQYEKEEG